jgi:hypothetical protein
MTEFSAYQMCSTVRSLAGSNKYLNARVERARQIMQTVRDANTQLKEAVATGTRMLTEEIEENNNLNEKIEMLIWKVGIMERALEVYDDDPA